MASSVINLQITPEDDLVAANLPALRERLRDLVRVGAQQITVDLANVEMVDSAGIGLLVSAHNSLKAADGQLVVINASQEILSLFRAMRMHQHFSINGKD